MFQGAGQDRLGIYIKSVVKGGAADIVSLLVTSNTFSLLHVYFWPLVMTGCNKFIVVLTRMVSCKQEISFLKLMGRA